ncbi:MAG: helix-turn-helix domain-containing protein [Patescibacteria group bacterium]
MNNKNYLTVKELAGLLKISRQAIIKKINNGQIKAEKAGRDYVIFRENLEGILYDDLTDKLKDEIKNGVAKVVREYGDVLKKLGRE